MFRRKTAEWQRLAREEEIRRAAYEQGSRDGSGLRGELDKIKYVVPEVGTGKEACRC